MKLSDKIVRNVYFTWAYYLISVFVGFFLMPFLVHRLGDATYGIWILVLSLTGYMGLLDLGVRSSIVKYVAQMHAKDEQEKLNELISTSFFTYIFIGFLVLCVTVIVTVYFNSLFHINVSLGSEAKIVLLLLGLNFAISLPLSVFGSVIWGFQRQDISSVIEIFVFLTRALLIVIFINAGFKLVALGIIVMVTSIFGDIVRIHFAWKINPDLRISYDLFKKPILKLIFSYGILIFFINIGIRIISYTDSIVIGLFMTTSAITYYAIAFRLVDYSTQFISAMSRVLMPTASEFEAKQEFGKIRRLLNLGTKYTLLLSLPLCFTLIIFGKPLVSLWMGEKYNSSATILVILIVPHVLAISQYISNVILQGIGKLKLLTSLIIFEALANLILSVILVRIYGLIGVAIGTAIPFIISKVIILPFYICRVVGHPLTEYIKKSTVLPFVANIPFVVLIYFLKRLLYPKTISMLVLEIIICFSIYGLISIAICMDKYERRFLWQPLRYLVFKLRSA